MSVVRFYFIPILIVFTRFCCSAQETVVIKGRLTDAVAERISVLKADRTVRQGLYEAIIGKDMALATGYYDHNKKVGVWRFFDPKGQLVEMYNYNMAMLTFEAPPDSLTNFGYLIDYHGKDTVMITRPIRIGGRYYGYISYLRLFRLPAALNGINKNFLTAIVELVVSPLGRLADYKVNIIGPNFKQGYHVNIDQLSNEDKTFIPATFHGQPVLSRILIKCFVADDGQIDFD